MASEPLETFDLNTSGFGFSAIGIDHLEATEYTLVTIAVDVSSSVENFQKELEKCLKSIVEACRHSPRADNLMLRVITFGSSITEVHGFKLLQDCPPDSYLGSLKIGGMTALYDAAVNAAEAAGSYGEQLNKQDYTVNGIYIVVTDGDDNHSTAGVHQVNKILEDIKRSEKLESLVSILVGVNITNPQVADYLKNLQTKANFNQYVEIDNASVNALAKLANFVSKSISAQSQALGTGGPSQALSY